MSTRFFIGMGLAFLLVFVGGIGAIVGINSLTDRPSVLDVSNVDRPVPVVVASLPAAAAISSVMPDAVLDSDLVSLASAVKLGTGSVGPDVWAREVPIAQKLLSGMCDCDQRNWLKHFVLTGQQSIAGSSLYPVSLRLLARLRKSNNDLASAQPAQ